MSRNAAPTETVRLDACAKGDVVRVPHSPTSSWKSIGHVVIDKIKPLAKAGMVQIKYRSRWSSKATVQKADLDGAIMVERSLPVPDDAPARTAEHDGIVYVSTDGRDAHTAMAEAVAAGRTAVLHGGPGAGMAELVARVAAGMGLDIHATLLRDAVETSPFFLSDPETLRSEQVALLDRLLPR